MLSKVPEDSKGRLDVQYTACFWQQDLSSDLLCTIPHIAVVKNWRKEQIKEHDHSKGVACDIKGRHQGVTSVVDLCPINADRKQTQPRVHLDPKRSVSQFSSKDLKTHPKYGVDFLVLRRDPRNESKCAQTCPDIVREPEQNKCKCCYVGKKAVSADSPPIDWCTAFRLVQSAEKDGG